MLPEAPGQGTDAEFLHEAETNDRMLPEESNGVLQHNFPPEYGYGLEVGHAEINVAKLLI